MDFIEHFQIISIQNKIKRKQSKKAKPEGRRVTFRPNSQVSTPLFGMENRGQSTPNWELNANELG